ncbi:MAG: hypothetical protein AB7D38_05645 [Sulfurimonas sp.]
MACLRHESAYKPLLLKFLFSEGKPSLPKKQLKISALEVLL